MSVTGKHARPRIRWTAAIAAILTALTGIVFANYHTTPLVHAAADACTRANPDPTLTSVPLTTCYVALGDSYSSGEGNPPFVPNDPCDLSQHDAWPELLTSDHTSLVLEQDLACADATTSALTSGYRGQRPQLQAMSRLTPPPTLITVTMGGNNLGFPYVLTACYVGSCTAALDAVEVALSSGFGTRMTAVYKEIKAFAPKATILVVGYPQILPSNPLTALQHCPWLDRDPEAVPLMNIVSSQLNSILARAAAAAGVGYVSTLNALQGHELCTADSWINSIGLFSGRIASQGHPNQFGQAAIARTVSNYIVNNTVGL